MSASPRPPTDLDLSDETIELKLDHIWKTPTGLWGALYITQGVDSASSELAQQMTSALLGSAPCVINTIADGYRGCRSKEQVSAVMARLYPQAAPAAR